MGNNLINVNNLSSNNTIPIPPSHGLIGNYIVTDALHIAGI